MELNRLNPIILQSLMLLVSLYFGLFTLRKGDICGAKL